MERDRNEFIKKLYHEESERLFRIAQRMGSSEDDAMDFVQSTFLLALFEYRKVMPHPCPEAWLTIVLYNLIKNERKEFRNHREVPFNDEIVVPTEEMPTSLSETLPSNLTEQEKEILICRFELQMAYREMANRFGISEDACRMRVSRAIEKCRQFFESED